MSRYVMKLNRALVEAFDFQALFNELGWDLPPRQQPYVVNVGETAYSLEVAAHKRGVQILVCQPDEFGRIPDYATRQKVERKVTAEVREHLVIFTDTAKTLQVWQWVSRESGRPNQYREITWRVGENLELLAQKLMAISFSLGEEETLSVVAVAQRLSAGFDRDRVTKKFYNEFDKQRQAFTAFIDGIPKIGKDIAEDQRWYTAVLIDRLMFLWFLQEKLFLDSKKNYLQSRLDHHLSTVQDGAPSFYRAFLCPLFFRGFAEARTDANRAAIHAQFGDVPYLNGGLFAHHQLETKYGEALDVADAAFEKLFAFFDGWDWHLDDRPLAKGNEVNPDVLGYIFEKFVNQKQMGAYYTKEDITEYIGKNTILPCLLAKVRAEHPGAFDALAWPLLQHSGDTYIYPAMLRGLPPLPRAEATAGASVRRGWGEGAGNKLPDYPPEITAGIDTEAPNLLERRKPWNKRADDTLSLPTEIWRETIARHQRTREVRAKIASGDLRDVGDLITYNLNIRQFVQDLIERCTDVALLKSFWFNLAGRLPRKSNEKFRHGLSVLDPTCGSGAFLFAALNILKPLYDATLRTLHAVRSDALIAGEKSSPEKWAEVDEILTRFATEKTDRAQSYAVIKHIIVNNLYGVDIEEQATEIAKLRLFLKLVALLEPGDDIEPLPDIDFNIRHGNTLVGYATEDETRKAVLGVGTQAQPKSGNLFDDAWEDIRLRLIAVEQQYNNFQIQQVQRGGHVSPADKLALDNTLHDLEETLNYHLAKEYAVDPTKSAKYEAWKASHQPFHWFVDFYPLMATGGFDVVIGNPPFVENRLVKGDYWPQRGLFSTEDAGNLYALCMERCAKALAKHSFAMIVPHGLTGLDDSKTLRDLLVAEFPANWFSGYAIRPAKLFDGVDQRLCIFVGHNLGANSVHVAGYRHWNSEERESLFATTRYHHAAIHHRLGRLPQIAAPEGWAVLARLEAQGKLPIKTLYSRINSYVTHYHRSPRYWIRAMDFEPYFKSATRQRSVHHFRDLNLLSTEAANTVCVAINSSLFFFWFVCLGNGRNLTGRDVEEFPLGSIEQIGRRATALNAVLMQNFKTNSFIRQRTDCEFQEFRPSMSKSILDEIDALFGEHFQFSVLELDYIINYDIKYRMGQSADDDGDD